MGVTGWIVNRRVRLDLGFGIVSLLVCYWLLWWWMREKRGVGYGVFGREIMWGVFEEDEVGVI